MQYFDFAIYALIFLFLVFIIVTYVQTIKLIKLGEKNHLILKEHLSTEEKKSQINSEYILMLDNLNQTMYNSLFRINREIIMLYKHFI
jgi:hypothetical protein